MKHAQVALLIHNARNRLTGILAKIPKEDTAARREVHATARQLAAAIALLRVEQEDPELHREEVDLRLFYHELIAVARFFRPDHIELKPELVLPPSHFGVWSFDSQLVTLVVLDALQNAYRSANTWVRVSIKGTPDRLVLEVADDGAGYPEHIFAESRQAGVQSVGTGLGLTLARQIASIHSFHGEAGQLILTNQPGATFTLSLP